MGRGEEEWKRISVELEKYGLISKLDRAALVLYCQAWAKMVWAEQQLSRAMKIASRKREQAEAAGHEYGGGDGIMVKTAGGKCRLFAPLGGGRHAASSPSATWICSACRHRRGPKMLSDNRQGQLFQEGTQDEWNSLGIGLRRYRNRAKDVAEERIVSCRGTAWRARAPPQGSRTNWL